MKLTAVLWLYKLISLFLVNIHQSIWGKTTGLTYVAYLQMLQNCVFMQIHIHRHIHTYIIHRKGVSKHTNDS